MAVGKENIEIMATRAAKKYLAGKSKTVNEAVMDIIKESGELSEEHIKRICETTNSTITQIMLGKERDKTIGFDLANSEVVNSNYTKEMAPAHKPTLTDYDKPPSLVIEKDKEDLEREEAIVKDILKNKRVDVYDDPSYIPPQEKAARLYDEFCVAEEWFQGQLGKYGMELLNIENSIRDMTLQGLISGEFNSSELEKLSEEYPSFKIYVRDVLMSLKDSGQLSLAFKYQNTKEAMKKEDINLNPEHPIFKSLEAAERAQEIFTSLVDGLGKVKRKKGDYKDLLVSECSE